MQRILLILILSMLSILLALFLNGSFATTTMKYFPIDEQMSFTSAITRISPIDQDNLEWSVTSSSSEEVYLRQDVSLLYDNGQFKGVLSKWREQNAHLELVKSFSKKNSGLLQAISFHHGEIHRANNKINSIQQMTTDHLYYIHEEDINLSFRSPREIAEKKWAEKLNKITKRQLELHWNKLMNNLQINQDDYLLIPLTDLIAYENAPFPGRTNMETKQIIGQLWEGLYANYIVLLANNEDNDTTHYIPLIMLAKDNSHLLVVFELNNEAQKLIQQLP